MKRKIRTDIIPDRQQFHGQATGWDYPSICLFAAIGFFLGDDTYYKDQKVLQPSRDYEWDDESKLLTHRPWFSWHYSPRNISFGQAVDEFTELFETVVKEQAGEKKMVLALSGGLDSRTQAAALRASGNKVQAFSYSFAGGHDETGYAAQIARRCNFPLSRWKVHNGYLWGSLRQLSHINQCYSEFTHPRQMAFVDRFAGMGDCFSLGHWGDVLFDDMKVPDNLPLSSQAELVTKKMVKSSGSELGGALWEAWGMAGSFREYLHDRISESIRNIGIETSANANVRAFKSLNWAPRWTSVNLSIFQSVLPTALPYYDNRLCQFICTIPEEYLAGRKIQIEYLRRRAPDLARITWQEHRPFNLYSYSYDRPPFSWPFRALNKLENVWSQPLIQRNWELQFIGEKNDKELRSHLFDSQFNNWIPVDLCRKFYDMFRTSDPVKYAHAVSMLLTLSVCHHEFGENNIR